MRPAIGKLLDENDKLVGTVFAISSSHAFTAFHCIGNSTTGQVRRKQVLIEFLTGEQIVGTYEAGSHVEDYAILSLQSPLPENLKQVPLLIQAQPNEPFRAAGYPISVHGSDNLYKPDISYIGGEVRAEDTSIFGGAPAIQLYSDEGAAGLSLHGMSGGPVLVGQYPEGAIGLVRWNNPRKDAPELGLGGNFWACPVRSIIDQHPEFSSLVQERSGKADSPAQQVTPKQHLLHNLPYRPYLFIGRKEETRQLKEILFPKDRSLASAKIPWVAIRGPGGTGKSYFVLNFVWDHLEAFETICWVNATGENITAAVAGLAKKPLDLGLPDKAPFYVKAQAVKERLASGGPHLIIFDNVDHAGSYVDFVPAGARVHVIVTTRREDLSEIDKIIELEPLSNAEALSLMRGEARWSTEEEQAALKLINRFNRITLPLALAGILMRTPRWQPTNLLEEIDKKGTIEWWSKTDLLYDKRFQTDPKLISLFDLFLELLKPYDSIDAVALKVLFSSGWLAPAPLPLLLFREMVHKNKAELDYDYGLLKNAISRLDDLGLATKEEDGPYVTFHQLVAHNAGIRGGAASRDEALDLLGDAAYTLMPNSFILPFPDLGGLFLAELEPHLIRAFDLVEKTLSPDHAWIPLRLAESLEAGGNSSKAIQILKRAARIAPDKIWEARFEAQSGRLLADDQRFEEAREVLEPAFQVLNDELEPCDIDTIVAGTKLAESFVELEKLDDALALLDALCAKCGNGGKLSTGGALACKKAAQLLIDQGLIEDGLLKLIQSMAMDTGFSHIPYQIHEGADEDFVTAFANYALQGDPGSIAEIIDYANEILGSEPIPTIIRAQHQAGFQLMQEERYGDALNHLEKALASAEQIYDPENLDLAATHKLLGETLLDLDRPEEAVKHLEQALAVAKSNFDKGDWRIDQTQILLDEARSR